MGWRNGLTLRPPHHTPPHPAPWPRRSWEFFMIDTSAMAANGAMVEVEPSPGRHWRSILTETDSNGGKIAVQIPKE